MGLAASAAMGFCMFRLYRLDRRLAVVWFFFALSILALSIADSLWAYLVLVAKIEPFPSLADVFYLFSYPLFLIAVVVLPSRKFTRSEWAKILLDIGCIYLSAVLIYWNLLLSPLVQSGNQLPLPSQILLMAYPVGDVILFASTLIILYRQPHYSYRNPIWWVTGGAAVMIVADTLFCFQVANGQHLSGNISDALFTIGYILFFLAAAQQITLARMGKTIHPVDSEKPQIRLPSWLSYTPIAWVAVAYSLMFLSIRVDLPMDHIDITHYVGAIIVFVFIRQIIVLHENERLSNHLQEALEKVQHQAQQLTQINQEMQVEILERRRVEERLSYDALHDSLTGLPNRALFLDRVGHALRKKKRNPNASFSILFLDLDGFKVINDSLGHQMGDLLLCQIAEILNGCVRGSDTVARLGGDEFVILLENVNSKENAIQTANRIQEKLSKPILLNGQRMFISVSIGVVSDSDMEPGDGPEDALRDADLAMYHAKFSGKGRHAMFDANLREQVINRLELENDLRRALECQQFAIYYQPVVSLPEQKLLGFEALLRWQHPVRGLLTPDEFLPIAEETGLIIPLGKWVLHELCNQIRYWQTNFSLMPEIKFSINISAAQLHQPDFTQTVAQALEFAALPGNFLCLEITESVCMSNPEKVTQTIRDLQAMGVEVVIDSFGTGYSSLSYLQQLPVQAIKIDRVFVEQINDAAPNAPDLMRAILSLLSELKIKAVAEGVENEVQLQALNRLNCPYAQGFLFAPPMNSIHAEKWLITKSGKANSQP